MDDVFSPTPNDIDRVFSRFTVSPTGCWEWSGGKTRGGYGQVSISKDGKRKTVNTHRLVYLWLRGVIPDNLVCDHLCRNRGCMNPWHLRLVTNRENVLAGIGHTARNARKTACKRGHEFTPENTYRIEKTNSRACKRCSYLSTKSRRAKLRTINKEIY